MDKGRKKIDLEPKTIEEKKMREAFEQWYHSREFVPHGVMIMNLCYLGFKQGAEYMRQQIKSACEFYLKYKDKPKLLGKDYPLFIEKIDEIYKKRIEAEEALGPNYEPSNSFTEEYNEWLFKEAFKCVLEEKENE